MLGHTGTLEDGVSVLHRDDNNYFECAAEISQVIQQFLAAPKTARDKMRRNAAKFANKAQWENFIAYYHKAYEFALNK